MSLIDRTGAESLIPVENANEIVQGVVSTSAALNMFRKLPNMTSKQQRIPVLDILPVAYWVNGDNGQKKLTNQAWKDKYLNAEEIAVIVPIREAVLDDSSYDIWGEVKPRIVEAFANVIDAATIGGVNKPASWPAAIIPAAHDNGYGVLQSSTFYQATCDAMEKVELSGYKVTGIIGGASLNSEFRKLIDTVGQLVTGTEIQALPRFAITNGSFDSANYKFIVGDFKQAVYSIRQDITFKLLTEGIIQDPSDNSILYNLGQQDMVALRAVMRIAYALPNPVNKLQPTEAARYPFAYCGVATAVKVATPTATGTTPFVTSTSVTLATSTYGAKIYYTTDGSTTPTVASTLYEGPVALTATTTIKAIGILTGYTSSDVVTATFTKS